MATSIPPHNVAELCDAALHLIDNPNATRKTLLKSCPARISRPAASSSTRAEIAESLHDRARLVPRARALDAGGHRARHLGRVVTEIPGWCRRCA
jgi:DNA gyrase/topoisomerase IV subunit A